MAERGKPIIITYHDYDEKYELDFNREAIRFAEQRGFDPHDVPKFPGTKINEFWYYAFRMHHKSLSRKQTDELLDKLGGLTPDMLERLVTLYAQAAQSNVLQDEEDLEKNGAATVEM